MFRSQKMNLVELLVLARDIDGVLEFLGTKADFQLHTDDSFSSSTDENEYKPYYDALQESRSYLGIPDDVDFPADVSLPSEADIQQAKKISEEIKLLQQEECSLKDAYDRLVDAYSETEAFAQLDVPYQDIENVTFLTIRIGTIDPHDISALQESIKARSVLVPLDVQRGRVFIATSKKGRFALDSELKKYNFTPIQLPEDQKELPKTILRHLAEQRDERSADLKSLFAKKTAYAQRYSVVLRDLLHRFSLATQIQNLRQRLEATAMVYRIVGWIPKKEAASFVHTVQEKTANRVAVRLFEPEEIPSVQEGREKVPVQYHHNRWVKSYERMVFSYGTPLYGTIDPTPIVAFFYTLLFGIMFGDLGQGAVFFSLGLALHFKRIPFLKTWYKFNYVFISIGLSSMVMGLLTGEFFANHTLLIPFARFATGLFGVPRDHILHLMPSANSITKLMLFFVFTLACGFIINSLGLIINIVNLMSFKKYTQAVVSEKGIAGLSFLWLAVAVAIKVFFFGRAIMWFDWILLVIPLIVIFFKEAFEHHAEGKPYFPEGLTLYIIQGLIEVMDTVSAVLSNSMSFLRVGAFALSHAVLSFVVFTLTDLVGGFWTVWGLLLCIIGNLIIIFLEGLIVAVQVLRLQYYEFFSKFFTETGELFTPFRFKYKEF